MSPLSRLSEQLRDSHRVRVIGSGRRSGFLPSWDGAVLSVSDLTGVVAHDVDDQVVEVWAGTPVEELQQRLSERGQCLPLASGLPLTVSQRYGTLGGLVAMNLPHALSSQCGGPRDWVLGMTVLRTDGTPAKCGSRAVKSVAGYDAHRLFVGSRGTLGLIASVILRTFPVKCLPDHQVEVLDDVEPTHMARTLPADYERTREAAGRLVAADPASCTLWSLEEPKAPVESWTIGPRGAVTAAAQPVKFGVRARQVFDPGGKLAPGWQE